MKVQFLKVCTLVLGLICIVSCSSDDDNTDTNASYIRAQIGGESWEATQTLTSTVLQVGDLGMRFDLSAQNEDIRFTVAANQFTVSECMDLTSYTGDNTLTTLWYAVGDGTYAGLYDEDPSNGDPGEENFVISITSCENGLISGTFSGTQFIIVSGSNRPDTVEITGGEFRNVPFTFAVIED
ncbi:MAG: hypothetical protein KUG68_08075 [Flavobacteriaceae bacterium]|nr:hypothetical protein [Flavobacteriaceae bacterium]